MKRFKTVYFVILMSLVGCGSNQDSQTESHDDSAASVELSDQNASFAINPKKIVSVTVTGSTVNPNVQQQTQERAPGSDMQVPVPSISEGIKKPGKIHSADTQADLKRGQDLRDTLTGVCIGLGCAAGGLIISRATGMIEPGLIGLSALGISGLKAILVPTDKTRSDSCPY